MNAKKVLIGHSSIYYNEEYNELCYEKRDEFLVMIAIIWLTYLLIIEHFPKALIAGMVIVPSTTA